MTRTDAPRRYGVRLRSGALVLGLIALSVFAGAASPASAAPSGPPDISNIGTLYPDSAPPSFLVSTPDTDTTVHVDWYAVDGGTTVLDFCPGTSTFSGTTASCTGAANLTPGIYDVMAYSEVGSDPGTFSPYSAAISVEVYGTAAAGFLAPYPTASSTDATPTFNGDGPARGTVWVYENYTTTKDLLCTAAVLNDGTWTCTANVGLGTHTDIHLDALDRIGGPSDDPGLDVTVTEIVDSQITGVDYAAAPWTTGNSVPDLNGMMDPNANLLTVEVGSTVTGPWLPYCHISNAQGPSTWGCSEPDNGLQHGTNYLKVHTVNEHGDASVNDLVYQVTLVDGPVITSPAADSFTNDTTPLFTGTGEGTDADVVDASNITQCSTTITAGTWSCGLPPLPDGTYKFHVVVTPGTSLTTPDLTLTIDTVAPSAPAIATGSMSSTDRTPTVSGSGEPFATIQLQVNGSPWACLGGAPIVDSGGAWSCTLANDLGVDSYALTVRQTDRAGNLSSTSASITVTVLPILAAGIVAPAPTATPFTWRLGSGLPDELHPGDQVVLSASNLPPGLAVDAEFHSKVVSLGSTSVRTDGTFSLPVKVPDDAALGLHHFVVTVWTPAGEAVVVEQPVTVIGFPKATSERIAQDGPGASTAAAQVDRSDPAAPSSFTHALNPIAAVFSNPVVIGIAAAAGLALFLLVAFPAELLNSTISEQYPRFAKRMPRAPWLTRFTDWIERTPIFGGIAITIVAAVIFGFADPRIGFDVTSFRVVLACAIALFVVGYLASLISGRIIRGRWKLDTVMELKPLGLILTVVGVVLSRLLDFSPGFLLGLILGISLVGSTTPAQRAKSTLVQAGVVFVLAILGWTLYSVLSAAGSPGDFGTALLFDTLVAITSEGLTAVFIGMLPFKFLDGPAVFEYSKPLWAVSFVVAAFAFVVVIVPSAWGELTGTLGIWIAIVGGFAVIALGIYLYFRFWAPAIDEGDEEEEPKQLEFMQRNEP